MRLTIAGTVFEAYSISTCARELALACHAAGIETAVLAPPPGGGFPGAIPDDELRIIQSLTENRFDNGFELRFPTSGNVLPSNRQVIRYVVTCQQRRLAPEVFGLNTSDYVWANSTFSLASVDCCTGFPFSLRPSPKSAVLHHGIDPDTFNPDGKGVAFEYEPFTFLFASRVAYDKGLPDLLRAFTEEFRGQRNVGLIIRAPEIAGDAAKWISDAKDQLWAPPIHVFAGKGATRDEMATFYRSANALVHPTRTEGFGLTVLEAAACGLPIVSTIWGGHLDILGRNHPLLVDARVRPDKYGMYSDPSEESLRLKLRECYERYKDFKSDALERSVEVRSRWSWHAIVEQIKEKLA